MNVVAAVIERDGRVLICQRKRGGRHALKWEFPGGKIEPSEEPRDALARELREELDIAAHIGEELACHQVRYGKEPPIRLQFFRVTEFTGEPMNRAFERIVWERRTALLGYDFLAGDVEFVRVLAHDS